eukprot:XP_011432573.1 PREDICTED: N-lysine methyltransferase KMT5A-A isoform X2 [Crassostrea gigas]
MAALSYGKRCLKAVLENDIKKKKKRLSPDAEAQRYCEAGLDKDGFEVKYISDYKGFGVFSVAEHAKGDFLLQYAGEKITKNEATERMKKSTENKFFFYCYKGQDLCIDAEGVSNSICHFVNDADKTANSVMKLKVFHEKEYLCLYAMKDIQPGEEIQYNYGDKENLWWRSKNLRMMTVMILMMIHLISGRFRMSAQRKITFQIAVLILYNQRSYNNYALRQRTSR